MANAVVSNKYGKRPVLDVPAMKAYGGVKNTSNVQYSNQVSSMMDYNTSSLIPQPQQNVQYVTVPQSHSQVVQQPSQQQTQYVSTQQPQVQYTTQQYLPAQPQSQPQQLQQPPVQYPTVPHQIPQQTTYQQPQPSTAYNPFASAQVDPRMAYTAPAAPSTDPNAFMVAMMGPLNPFNPGNMLAAPLAPPPVPMPPSMAYPPPPNYPPPGYNRGFSNYPQPPPDYRNPAMNQPVHTSPDDNYSIQGKLEYGKMTTVHVDSITGNFKQLPEILRKELKRTYGKYPETDIKISVENGEFHIYASPHREDDRPIRGPRAYDEDDRRPIYNPRQPRINEEFRPKVQRQDYDPDFVRGRGFEAEPRRSDEYRRGESRMTDAEWVLVKRR